MAQLFGKDRKTITRHIQNIYKDEELEEISVCSYFGHTGNDEKNIMFNFIICYIKIMGKLLIIIL